MTRARFKASSSREIKKKVLKTLQAVPVIHIRTIRQSQHIPNSKISDPHKGTVSIPFTAE